VPNAPVPPAWFGFVTKEPLVPPVVFTPAFVTLASNPNFQSTDGGVGSSLRLQSCASGSEAFSIVRAIDSNFPTSLGLSRA
jgi:hypothetical protein